MSEEILSMVLSSLRFFFTQSSLSVSHSKQDITIDLTLGVCDKIYKYEYTVLTAIPVFLIRSSLMTGTVKSAAIGVVSVNDRDALLRLSVNKISV